MSHTLSNGARTACLIFGVVEALGAGLWLLAGAGVYGSPLAGMDGPELARIGAFLLAGPLSALLAAIVVLRRPRWGAAWLVAGGFASGALAVPFLRTDAHILPLALVSLPMLVVGLWLIKASADATGSGAGSEHPVEPGRQQDSRSGIGSVLLGVLLFLIAAVGTYALTIALAINNVTGLRGAIRPDNPLIRENQDLADGIVVVLVATAVVGITMLRKRLRLRWEAVAGTWAAVLLGGLILLLR
ncbi:MAG: hypothetical protein KF688_12060 [Pirellulales bacterium]|nr:hypothetical protein [Pirellulales bacterium]